MTACSGWRLAERVRRNRTIRLFTEDSASKGRESRRTTWRDGGQLFAAWLFETDRACCSGSSAPSVSKARRAALCSACFFVDPQALGNRSPLTTTQTWKHLL